MAPSSSKVEQGIQKLRHCVQTTLFEYVRESEDYGLVNAHAAALRLDMHSHDSTTGDSSYGPPQGSTFARYWRCLDKQYPRDAPVMGSFQYADVRGGDTAHAQSVVEEAKASKSEKIPEPVERALQKMIEGIRELHREQWKKEVDLLTEAKRGPCPDGVEDDDGDEDEANDNNDVLDAGKEGDDGSVLGDVDGEDEVDDERWIRKMRVIILGSEDSASSSTDRVRGIRVPSEGIVRYLIRQPDPEEKKLLLWGLTQPESTNPRPVIILLEMLDDYQSTESMKTTGYRLAYDFITNTVMAEPFVSSPDHNPFHHPWSSSSATGEAEKHIAPTTRFRGTPGTLIEKFLKESVPGVEEEGIHKLDDDLGFALVLRLLVMDWTLTFYEDLQILEPTKLTAETERAIHAKSFEIKDKLREIPFPQPKDKPSSHDRQSPRMWFEQEVLEIDTDESEIRGLAREAREKYGSEAMERILRYQVERKMLAERARDACTS